MLNFKFKILNSKKGFTLIEAIVSASLFAFVMTSILGTYLTVLRLNTRLRAERALAQNARFITEFFAKEIRNGRIDYTHGTYSKPESEDDPPAAAPDLWLVNQNNESEHFYLGESLTACKQTSACGVFLEKNGVSAPLNSNLVKVTFLQFAVNPGKDPFIRSNGVNDQPHVTLTLELTANMGQRDASKILLRSTYSELYYPSRQ